MFGCNNNNNDGDDDDDDDGGDDDDDNKIFMQGAYFVSAFLKNKTKQKTITKNVYLPFSIRCKQMLSRSVQLSLFSTYLMLKASTML